MPKPFDATLKGLLEVSPVDWTVLAGHPSGRVDVIDADVSTFSGGADKVLRVSGTPDWILHLEFQAGPDATLPRRLHVYNALLEDRHNLPVRSVAVLLRPQADRTTMTGVYERGVAEEAAYLRFGYQVIRVWQMAVEQLLAGGLGTLPLAPISAVTEAELPGVLARMKQVLRSPRQRPRAGDLWTAAYVLLGLRYDRSVVNQLLQGVLAMEESDTYQAILAQGKAEGKAEGEAKGLREALLILGRQRFGPPGPEVLAALEALGIPELEQLIAQVATTATWHELLPPPRPRRRRRRQSQ